ncbi:MAG: TonB family protein [Flavobacteriales bacterium]|nr:TonB family protein [Flavobacteriales bacterium]
MMIAWSLYLLKANVVFTLLFLAYRLILRRTTFFMGRRAWLLGSLLAAAVLPGVQSLPSWEVLPMLELPLVEVNTFGTTTGVSWWYWAGLGYTLVTLVLLFRLVRRVRAAWVSLGDPSDEARSFFRVVSLPVGLDTHDRAAILAHEQVHVRHGHTFDVLLFEVASALSWLNPIWWPALRELRTVHEYTADELASRAHPDYGAVMVAHALGVPSYVLVNSFRSHTLTTRFHMMQQARSKPWSAWRFSLAIPVLLLCASLVSWQAVPFPGRNAQQPASTVDKKPQYPGGMTALAGYMGKAITYDATAKKEGIEGVVIIAFVVDANGQVQKARVERSLDERLDKEALRVVKGMPRWEPGMKDGKAVPAEMKLPVKFELTSEK